MLGLSERVAEKEGGFQTRPSDSNPPCTPELQPHHLSECYPGVSVGVFVTVGVLVGVQVLAELSVISTSSINK